MRAFALKGEPLRRPPTHPGGGGAASRWYLAPALGKEATSSRGRRAARLRALGAATACAGIIGLAGCGGDAQSQDENEPVGEFPVEVTTAKFPPNQRLAETVDLQLEIENAGSETVPDLAVTIWTGDEMADGPFNLRSEQEGLADPNRPVWILENDYPKLLEPGTQLRELDEEPTAGAETAATNTYTFGALGPGDSVHAVWRVTPVKGGTYTVHYEVAGGIDGNAKAVTEDGGPVEGEFVATISTKPPKARVTESGAVVEEP
jgi:hypothetical protein